MLEEWFGCIFMLPLIDCLKVGVAAGWNRREGEKTSFFFWKLSKWAVLHGGGRNGRAPNAFCPVAHCHPRGEGMGFKLWLVQ